MSEGELKKRIIERIEWLQDKPSPNNSPCSELRIYELEIVKAFLDEAKKDLKKRLDKVEEEKGNGLPPYYKLSIDNSSIRLGTYARWYIDWFGSP
jgi:hypothetical protein